MRLFNAGNWKIRPTKLYTLAFADDMVLLADSAENMQAFLETIIDKINRRGLRIKVQTLKPFKVKKRWDKHTHRT